jgi:hypothetical protein
MRYHVRCRKCQARRVLSKHPDAYALAPVCRSIGCGSRAYRVDKWMMNRNTSATGLNALGCNCGGVPFSGGGNIHRKGTTYCWFRKDGSPRYPGDPDFKDARED